MTAAVKRIAGITGRNPDSLEDRREFLTALQIRELILLSVKLCTVHRTSVQETVEDSSQSAMLFPSKVRAPDMDQKI
jgi:hypothetical protein